MDVGGTVKVQTLTRWGFKPLYQINNGSISPTVRAGSRGLFVLHVDERVNVYFYCDEVKTEHTHTHTFSTGGFQVCLSKRDLGEPTE